MAGAPLSARLITLVSAFVARRNTTVEGVLTRVIDVLIRNYSHVRIYSFTSSPSRSCRALSPRFGSGEHTA